jgi:hypothetical protein
MNESHVLDVTCFIRSLLEHLNALLVAVAGLEPARAKGPEDFLTTLAFTQAIYLRCCSLDYFFTMQ